MNSAPKAVLLMIAAMFLIPAGDTAGKLLTASGVSPCFVAWSRFLLGALMLLPILGLAQLDLRLLRDWRIWLRSLMVIGAIVSILTALRTEPIANVFAAFFVGPILSYFLSARLLGEPISRSRTLLLGLGFVGVLMVVKPGADMGQGMPFALLAGMFYGSYLTTSRWLAGVAAPRMLLMTQLIIGAVLLAPVGVFAVPAFGWSMSGLVIASAACSMLGNLLLVMAYRLLDATLLAPLVYVQLVAATLFGVLVFGVFPDLWAMAGMLLLIGSGLGSFLLSKAR